MAFHENDFTYPPTCFPPNEVDELLKRWVHPRPGMGGAESQMGTKLYRTFVDAGLPGPELRVEAPVGGGPNFPGYEYTEETVRSLLPMLQKFAGVDPAVVDVDTLAERLRREVVKSGGVMMLPLMFGAWSRRP